MLAKQLSVREKIISGVTCVLVLSYALYYGILIPFKEKVDAMQSQIEVLHRKTLKDSRLIRQAQAYQKQYEQILGRYKQNTSDEKVMSQILSGIEKVAGESKMSIEEMKPQRVKKVDFYNHFSVSLALDGKLTEILRFLEILQNDPHYFEVEELRLDKTSPHIPTLKCRLIVSKIAIP